MSGEAERDCAEAAEITSHTREREDARASGSENETPSSWQQLSLNQEEEEEEEAEDGLLLLSDDSLALPAGGGAGGGRVAYGDVSRARVCLNGRKRLVASLAGATVLLVAIIVGLSVVGKAQDRGAHDGEYVIAFGSCTAYDAEKQAIWTDGVIPLAPDAWIWLGDIVYLDDPSVDCRELPNSPQCDCETDWLLTSPFSCFAGDPGHARDRWQSYLSNRDYMAFLDYMCPGSFAHGYFPPPGTDKSVCPRPILGVYDDHDFGWNNGNHRQPDKQEFKLMFLDAIGEAADSERRKDLRGAWGAHTLDANGVEVEVFLLDERYNREELPCWTQRDYCQAILDAGPSQHKYQWCADFLLNGSALTGGASCCDKDEKLFRGWCTERASKAHPL